MIGRTILHYQILEKLGEGGMGVVYKAHDTRLNRPVALKFLLPQVFDTAEQRELFIQEAQTAAALDHPNICTIYEINEADGQVFFSMSYLVGDTLEKKIEPGPLEVDEALDIAAQLAAGLEAAHEKGIVHRDIKCSNVLVTPEGWVKIMDFGLARAAEVLGEPSVITSGTAAYMSPEQARGDPTDHRTDIWSWGICLYKMLTGRLPFRGTYDAAVTYSVLNEEPVPVTEWRADLPVAVIELLDRALAKDPARRFQSMMELSSRLAEVRRDLEAVRTGTPAGPAGARPAIAVLPFTDMSPEGDQEYFCDGIAEEIINALTKVENLHVVARTSAFAFKGRTEDVRGIGHKLNVAALLEGSVRKAGTRLRITTQLINVADGFHIWSKQFDRELKDVFAIQEEIARSVVNVLEITLSDREKRALEKPATTDLQAFDYYLRGRKSFYRSKREGILEAIEMFRRAIEKDGRYALAFAGMADCYSYLYMYFESSAGNLAGAEEASRRALELDPELAEAHAARGLAVSLNKQYEEAERQFDTAMKLKPVLYEASYFYARTCFAQGKFRKAAQLYEQACRVNPEDYQACSLLGFTYRTMHLLDQAKAAYRRSLDQARRHLERNPDDSRALYLGACALVELGDPDKGIEWARRALEIDPDDPYNLYGIACLHSRLGRVDEAIHYFKKSLSTGFAHKEWIEHDSDFDPIRDDPRFRALLEKL
jgi:TolB-like protein/Tfp pilus assembly protein PilF